MKTLKTLTTFTIAIVTMVTLTWAATAMLSVDEIVTKANNVAYYSGDDGKANVHMTITDGQGRTREREMTILRKDIKDGGDQNFYVYFKQPSDVRKMVFMVHKHVTTDDDRWLFLPALDLVKRIAASDKRTSFVGSDFVYEDVSGRSLSEDNHELIETTGEHYVIKNTPIDKGSVEFGHYTIWIDKATFLPVKAHYFDKSGKHYRTVEALETKTIDGFPTVVKSKVSNELTGGHTVAVFSDVEYNIGLKDDIFTERYLRRAPREARR